MDSRSDKWCFTINNYTSDDEERIQSLRQHCSYIVCGKEVCPTTGTPHLQGYAIFDSVKRRITVSKLLPRAYLTRSKGTARENQAYCTKEGNVLIEHGQCPESKKTLQEQYKECILLAKDGELDIIADRYPGIYLRYLSTFKSLRASVPRILDELLNEWWVGPTGTGKSRTLWEVYPDHYGKPLNKWWDGYSGEDVVAMEELNPESSKYLAHHLKIWADRYPFTAEIKGGTLKKIRPGRIIVLSNYTIEECFPMTQDQDPIKRRFKVKHFFPFFPNCMCDSQEELKENQ